MKPFSAKFHKSGAANSVHWLVAVIVAVSALAWAWHVDIPAALDEQAVVSATSHSHVDNGDLVDVCDHCCHAGAHSIALLPAPVDTDLVTPDSHRFITESRLTTAQQDPPYIPPIA